MTSTTYDLLDILIYVVCVNKAVGQTYFTDIAYICDGQKCNGKRKVKGGK